MSKNMFVVTAVAFAASSLALVGSASAGDVVPTDWFDVDDGLLGAFEAFDKEFIVSGSDGMVGVAGFEVRFDYSEPIDDRSWASDVQIIVTAPNSDNYIVGGLTNLASADEDWSFQGEISEAEGHYGDSGADVFLPWFDSPRDVGVYGLLFTNDWETDPNANLYESVQIRFYLKSLPAPGALTLMGLAGLAARRRRRPAG